MEAPVKIVPEIAKLLVSERRTGAVAEAKLEEDEQLTAWLQAVNTATERTPVQLEGGLEVVNLDVRSEEHTPELQSLMRISYAVFCLQKKKNTQQNTTQT